MRPLLCSRASWHTKTLDFCAMRNCVETVETFLWSNAVSLCKFGLRTSQIFVSRIFQQNIFFIWVLHSLMCYVIDRCQSPPHRHGRTPILRPADQCKALLKSCVCGSLPLQKHQHFKSVSFADVEFCFFLKLWIDRVGMETDRSQMCFMSL